ncbi:MAG: hypothetical protein ACRBFS_02030 [Aureispira sp.]
MLLSHQYSLLMVGFLSVLLTSNAWTQPPPMHNEKTVRTETCWIYPIINGIAAKQAYRSASIHYNRQGRKSKMTLYNKRGQTTKEYLYAYLPGQCETYQLLSDGSKFITAKEEYGQENKVTSHIRYKTDGGIDDKKLIEYNQAGKKIKEEYFVSNGNDLEQVYVINYAHYNTGIRESYTNYTDQTRHAGATQLDDNQLPTTYSQYASSGELIRKIHYDRTPQGRLTSIKFLEPDESIQVREDYEYNGSNMHCLVYDKDGKQLVEHVMYQYDYYQ